MPGRRGERQLVHAVARGRDPGWSRGRGPGSPRRARRGRRRGAFALPRPAAAPRRGPSPPRAPSRSWTAPSSGHRCSSRRGRRGGTRRPRASFSRLDPGSVTATKRLPALPSPDGLLRTRSKKYALKMLGSRVEPDLLETMNRVFARSSWPPWRRICRRDRWSPGRGARGNPAILPKVSFQTSGHRLEPPIPRSTAWAKPSPSGPRPGAPEAASGRRAAARRSRASRSSWPRPCRSRAWRRRRRAPARCRLAVPGSSRRS